ncbi:MAG TPA: DUF4203 domain-containing protein [Thermoanaerobaculia bacterium]|nr:DUF4203 domain-containing protein [Thermoanaerobaculia bacterium]
MHFHTLADPNAQLFALVAGALLLLAGRRLFWLFVGIVGFYAASTLLLRDLHLQPYGARLLVAIVAGMLGMLLAIFFQKVAVGLAGFLVGVYAASAFLGVDLTRAMRLPAGSWLVMLAAGILCGILALWLFDLALVVLSSIAGAGLIVDAARFGATVRPLALVVLAVVGVAVQLGWTARRRVRAG